MQIELTEEQAQIIENALLYKADKSDASIDASLRADLRLLATIVRVKRLAL